MITSPSIEDKSEIIFSTSFGHIIGFGSRSGKETFRLNHLLRQGNFDKFNIKYGPYFMRYIIYCLFHDFRLYYFNMQ